jgi:hypothetical protein
MINFKEGNELALYEECVRRELVGREQTNAALQQSGKT